LNSDGLTARHPSQGGRAPRKTIPDRETGDLKANFLIFMELAYSGSA